MRKNAFTGNSTLIFAAGAVLGLVSTVIFLIRGQRNADDIMAERDEYFESGKDYEWESETDETEEDCNDEDQNEEVEVETPAGFKERAALTWQCYIPGGISALFTLICILGGAYFSWKAIAGLTGSMSFLLAEKGRLERAAREKFGDEAVDELKRKLAMERQKEVIKRDVIKEKCVEVQVEHTGNGDMLCRDLHTGVVFRSTLEALIDGVKKLDEIIKTERRASYGDLYYLWGLRHRNYADKLEWIATDTYSNIDPEVGLDHMFYRGVDPELNEECIFFEVFDIPEIWPDYVDNPEYYSAYHYFEDGQPRKIDPESMTPVFA